MRMKKSTDKRTRVRSRAVGNVIALSLLLPFSPFALLNNAVRVTKIHPWSFSRPRSFQCHHVTMNPVDYVNSTDGDYRPRILSNRRLLSTEQIEEIKSYADIVSVIESFQLPQFTKYSDGSRATALCPFHEDTNPSLSIDRNRGIFKCFACGAGGDIFHFIREYDYRVRLLSSNSDPTANIPKLSYPKAIQYVIHNFLPPNVIPNLETYFPPINNSSYMLSPKLAYARGQPTFFTPRSHASDKYRIYLANAAAADFYGNLLTLPVAGIARTHLRTRNIHPKTVRSFALGYAPDYYTSAPHHGVESSERRHMSLVHRLHDMGFTPNEMIDAGLAIVTSAGKKRMQAKIKLHEQRYQTTSWNETDDPKNSSTSNMSSMAFTFHLNDIMDRFRSRLVIPIFDSSGLHIIGFGGRILTKTSPQTNDQHNNEEENKSGDVTITSFSSSMTKRKFKNAKYINSPESAVFSKKNTLFGLHAAKALLSWENNTDVKDFSFLKEPPSLIIVEGYFDVIALYDAGIRDVVASMGTSLSMEQLTQAATMLQEHNMSGKPSRIILCLDNDSAGISAVARLCQGKILYSLMREYSIEVFVATLPANVKDPSEFIESQRNAGGFSAGHFFRKQVLENVVSWQKWYIQHIVDRCVSVSNDRPILGDAYAQIATFISMFHDPEDQSKYIALSIDAIRKRQSMLNTTQSMRDTIESEIASLVSRNHASLETSPSETFVINNAKVSRINGSFKQGSGVTNGDPIRTYKSSRKFRTKNFASKKSSLMEHFKGFIFNHLDASWLDIDESKWNRGGNLVLGNVPTIENNRKFTSESNGKMIVYFNSDEYLGKKFLTKNAIAAGYNPSVRQDHRNMILGTGTLLLHDNVSMLDHAEKKLLKLLTFSPKARVVVKELIDTGKHSFIEWSCFEREWLFQNLIGAPGRDPLPIELQETNGMYDQLRNYLVKLHDRPDGAFLEEDKEGDMDGGKIITMKYEENSLLNIQDENYRPTQHCSSTVGSLEQFFVEEDIDSEALMFAHHSEDETYVEFMVQASVSNMLSAHAGHSMESVIKEWSDKSYYTMDNPADTASHLSNLHKRINATRQHLLNTSQTTRKITSRFLNSILGDSHGEKRETLLKSLDEFVHSLPEDTHRPDQFDENYIFGSDDLDGRIDSRFGGRKSKIDWEAVRLDFESILE